MTTPLIVALLIVPQVSFALFLTLAWMTVEKRLRALDRRARDLDSVESVERQVRKEDAALGSVRSLSIPSSPGGTSTAHADFFKSPPAGFLREQEEKERIRREVRERSDNPPRAHVVADFNGGWLGGFQSKTQTKSEEVNGAHAAP